MLTVKEPSNIEVELADSDGTPSGSKCEEDNAAAADAVATKHSMRFHLAFLTILICNFIVSLNQVSIAASLSTIAVEFKASTNDAYWCAIGYELAQTVSQPIVGSLSEVFGRKIMLQTSLTIFLVASVLCARAESIHWLIGARVVQGIGGGGLATLTTIIVSDMTTIHERAKYFGLMGLSFAFGNFGILMGAGISQHSTWRWIFYINIPMCVLCIAATHIFLNLSLINESLLTKFLGLDWVGIITFAGSLSSLLFGIASGGVTRSWSSGATIAPMVIGVIGLTGFVLLEIYVAKKPMIPLKVFRSHNAKIGMVAAFVLGFSLATVCYYLIIYFLGVALHGVIHSSVDIMAALMAMPPGSMVASALIIATKDFRVPLWLGLAMSVAGIGALPSLSPSTGTAQREGLQVLLGIGLGLIFPAMALAVQLGQPDDLHGPAVNISAFFRTMGQTFGLAIGVTIFQNTFDVKIQGFIKEGVLGKYVITGQEAEGAFSVLRTFPAEVVEIYRKVYAESVRNIWYTTVALVAVALVFSMTAKASGIEKRFTSRQRFEEKRRQETTDG